MPKTMSFFSMASRYIFWFKLLGWITRFDIPDERCRPASASSRKVAFGSEITMRSIAPRSPLWKT